ncbi:MAG: beta-propeller fold lactonase family protein [Thermoanaerobaculales bacterium]|nr:beta-propeller fold lactonase family protein [Thermoanaerobaculales bacterium]
MFSHNHLRHVVLVCLCILLAAAGSWAELSEPDHIIYGSASLYGEALVPGSPISLALEGVADPVARYTMGSDPEMGDFYVLRVPLDAVGDRFAGAARTGDPGSILIDGQVAGQIVIGERGTVQKMDVDPENVEATPSLTIDDVSVEEGDAGTVALVFTVSLSPPSEDVVTADWITGDGTAVGGGACGAGIDYIADSGMVTIDPGNDQATITILACGETEMEDDESFFVDLLNPSNAVLLDPQGRGTIIDDDTPPQLSINNVTITEPQTGTIGAFFRVSSSRLWDQEVSFDYTTSEGTADAGLDYLSTSGMGTIPVGSLETTVEVEILADTLNEEEETFFVTLSNSVNSSILDGEGQGIIVDAAQFLMWLEAQVDGVSSVDGLAGAYASAPSPDGLHLYVAGSADNGVALFDRNTTTGALTFIHAYTADDFTGRAVLAFTGLGGPADVIVSDDGLNVYVAAFDDDAVTVFSRDPADGSLALVEVEINGENDLGDPGDVVDGLDGPTALALSPSHPDGQHLYVAGYNSGAVAVFERDPVDGSLSFVEVETDGVNDPSDHGGEVDGLHLASDVVVSGDGASVYVAGQGDNAVAVFERETDLGSGTLGRLSFLEVEKDGAAGVDGLAAATALAITADGDHLYVAGQSDNAIAVFSREASGLLDWVDVVIHGVAGVEGLLGASGVTISEDDRYVYSCGYLSNAVTVFERDTDDLEPSYGSLEYIEVKTDGVGGVDGLFRPTSLAVSPGDGNVYVTGYSDNAVAVFRRDLTAPANPTLTSTTHVVSEWSNVPVIGMEWSGAVDDPSGSGVAGYSFLFDTQAITDADEALDLAHTLDPHSTFSATLADGVEHYFHLLTCDHSDNCSASLHVGSYWIDTLPPEDVVIIASSHVVGVPSYDDTIQMWWSDPAIDPGATPSGVFGYSYTFNSNPVGQCNFEVDVPVGTGDATSLELKAGLWYFHVCAVDNAGNWSTPATGGPYEIINDTIPPKVINLSTVSAPSGAKATLAGSEAHGITQFLLTFSKQMFDPVDDTDPNDVTNPANYQLVFAGSDALFQTDICGGVGGDDVVLPVNGAVYNSSTTTAALAVGGGTSLPMGRYRVFGCSVGGLEDINQNPLDGDGDGVGGDDFVFTLLMERTNLLLNPNLDESDLASAWTLSNSERISHSGDDADGAETSGSIRIHRETGDDDREFSISQCVAMPAWDGSDLHLSAVVRVNEPLGGDPGASGAFAGVTYLDSPNCSGTTIGVEMQTNVVVDDTEGAWLPINTDLGPAPPAALSALVSLAVQIPLSEDYPFDAWFDNVLFQFSDTAPPVDPIVASTTHVAGTWGTIPEINMNWNGATDAGVGVAGYSFHFDTAPATLPDDVLDLEHAGGVHATSSGVLADGQWYFHLRTCDYVSNCTSTVHEGWYGIDTVSPANPTAIVSTSHTLGLESVDSVIEMSWTPAVDSPPVPSGVLGYAFAFDCSASGSCDQVVDLSAGESGVSSDPLLNGDWYFHICTVDVAGNWSLATTIGPYVINDDVPPTILSLDTVSSTPGGMLDWAESTSLPITQLLVAFSEPMNDPEGNFVPDDVTNPQNYRLVDAGFDGVLDTVNCGSIQNDDSLMAIDFVIWDLETGLAAVGVGNGLALPSGFYGLFACGSTTITDVNGNALDGDTNGTGGDDFVWAFQILGTNLIENPNFDGNMEPWVPADAPPASFAFDAGDLDGAATSGSGLITGVSGADLIVGLSQCIDVSSMDIVMGLSGRVLLTNNSTPDPAAYGIVTFYDGAGCSGAEIGELGTDLVVGDTGGAWAEIPWATSPKPAGALSAWVSFAGTGGADPGADFDAAFDSLIFGDGPTMIFSDGFESGTTSAWSGS